MSFITDTQARQAVADALKVELASLPDYWTNLVSEANIAAYGEIQGCLIGRGYTQAQVDSWDRGAEFQKQLAVFWSLTRGGGLAGYDDRFIKLFDRRKDLLSVQVFSAGVFVPPGSAPGLVRSGQILAPDVESDTVRDSLNDRYNW